MIVQADRVDLGAAFTFLLFDAQDAAQSKLKTGHSTSIGRRGWVECRRG